MPKADKSNVTVRLKEADAVALEWVKNYITHITGAGVEIGSSDAIRWALHTCRAGLEQPEVSSNAQSS